ncbi:MAG: hypothetical protein D6718_12765 [Acidobacteria bacterium]|nr:MAG: hypothetical protein D6718_12765 [Acidobacteriota bacterium]
MGLAARSLLAIAALAAAPGPLAVYDGEFRGYAPVVDGVERPDLAARDGRLPDDPRVAEGRARRALRPFSFARWLGRLFHRPRARYDRPRRSWLRRRAVVTRIEVHDPTGAPVAGARIYRYHDPSFYAVNDDESGARLFGRHRYLPYPFPAALALSFVEANEERWIDSGMAEVRATGPDIDDARNPWRRDDRSAPHAPIEFVGVTDESGILTAVDGVFNLRDGDRFPLAVVPSALRVGYIVTAPGYLPGLSERRFERGGLREERHITLLPGPDHALLASTAFRAAMQLAGEMALPPAPARAWIEAALDRLTTLLGTAAAGVPPERREAAVAEAKARLLDRLLRRLPREAQVEAAALAVELTPGAAVRRERLGAALALAAGVGRHVVPSRAPDPTEARARAERELRRALASSPYLLEAPAILDRLLAERGAPAAERLAIARGVFEKLPFDRWARARLAVFALRAGRDAEADDHLRYTYAMVRGMAGDRELAAALSERYWRLGLPEKGAFFAFLFSGRVPEAPFARPR